MGGKLNLLTTLKNTGCVRAIRKYPIENKKCAFCKKPARYRHHADHDVFNNEETNIQFVCPFHHAQLHPRSIHTEYKGILTQIDGLWELCKAYVILVAGRKRIVELADKSLIDPAVLYYATRLKKINSKIKEWQSKGKRLADSLLAIRPPQ